MGMKKRETIRNVVLGGVLGFAVPFSVTVFLYEKIFGKRYEEGISFDGAYLEKQKDLCRERVTFSSSKGQRLVGYFYQSNKVKKQKAIIVVAHGIGCVHTDYIRNIHAFTKAGYLVFAYDATGSGESEGKTLLGLSQSPIDLHHALLYLEENERCRNLDVLLYGHSWGGYAVATVLNYGHKIKGVIARSGFSGSVELLVCEGTRMYGNYVKCLSPFIYLHERRKFKQAVKHQGFAGITKTKAKVLLYHGKRDRLIPLEYSLFDQVQKEKDKYPHIETKLIEDKGHDIMLTHRALAYRRRLKEQQKQKQQITINPDTYNEVDQSLMTEMIGFFDQAIEM